MNTNIESTPSRRAVLSLLGAAPLVTGVGPIGTAWATGSERARKDMAPGGEFDRFVAQLAAEDRFSGTVRVVHRDRPVLRRSYGMANRRLSIPNSADTIFGIASVNKLFTGVAVARMVQRGAVSYHEKVGAYLDGFPAEVADGVTVHHLLTHTSGVGRPANDPAPPPGSGEWDTAQEAWDGTFAYLRGLPLVFPPGTRRQYSNDGYFLLAAIVTAVSEHDTYHEHLRQEVFGPAGMADTDVYTTHERLNNPRIAHSYDTAEPGEHVDITESMPLWQAAGDPYSTAGDLVAFARALRDNTLLDEHHTQIVLSPKLPLGGGAISAFHTYAPVARLMGQWVLGHNGGGQGISGNVDWFPESDWAVVVLSNYSFLGPGTATEAIAAKARELITG